MWRCRGESVSPRDEEGGANLHLLLPWPGSLLHTLAPCVDDTALLGERVLHQPTGSTIWMGLEKVRTAHTHTHLYFYPWKDAPTASYSTLEVPKSSPQWSHTSRVHLGSHIPQRKHFLPGGAEFGLPCTVLSRSFKWSVLFRTDLWGSVCVGQLRVERWGSLCNMYKKTEGTQEKQHLFANDVAARAAVSSAPAEETTGAFHFACQGLAPSRERSTM